MDAVRIQHMVPATSQFVGTIRLIFIENPRAFHRMTCPTSDYQLRTSTDDWCAPTWIDTAVCRFQGSVRDSLKFLLMRPSGWLPPYADVESFWDGGEFHATVA